MFTYKNEKSDPIGTQFKMFAPPIAAGASKVYFDFWNGSNKTVEFTSVTPVVSGAVAVVGTLAVDLYLTRTTAIGTGGTGATADGVDPTAMTISRLDNAGPGLPPGISARLAPGGGATAGAVLAFNSHFTEETALPSYFRMNLLQVGMGSNEGKLKVPPGTGIRVIQGTVASVGNIGFDALFQVID